jgi:hypothetical protein
LELARATFSILHAFEQVANIPNLRKGSAVFLKLQRFLQDLNFHDLTGEPLKERDPNPSLPCRVKKMMVPKSASQ